MKKMERKKGKTTVPMNRTFLTIPHHKLKMIDSGQDMQVTEVEQLQFNHFYLWLHLISRLIFLNIWNSPRFSSFS